MNAPLYLTAGPALRATRYRWDRQLAELRTLMPGTELIDFTGLPPAFAAVPREERPARLARALSGAVLVPDKLGRPPRRWIGRVALAEAEAFAALGKPVRAYMAGELFAWADVEVVPRSAGYPKCQHYEVIAPRFPQAAQAAA